MGKKCQITITSYFQKHTKFIPQNSPFILHKVAIRTWNLLLTHSHALYHMKMQNKVIYSLYWGHRCLENYTFGALAATFAASAYCPFWKSVLNFLTNRSSAPGRLQRDEIFRARSGFCSVLVIYCTIVSSSTLTDNTCITTNNGTCSIHILTEKGVINSVKLHTCTELLQYENINFRWN